MARPVFCPNCGHKLPDGERGAVPIERTTDGESGWDCWCDNCPWSGDIMPDGEDAPVFNALVFDAPKKGPIIKGHVLSLTERPPLVIAEDES